MLKTVDLYNYLPVIIVIPSRQDLLFHLLWFPAPWQRLHVPPGQIGPSHQSWQGLFSLAGISRCYTVKPGSDLASFNMILSNKRITKALIRLCGSAGWSVPLLFAKPWRQNFSHWGPVDCWKISSLLLKRVDLYNHLPVIIVILSRQDLLFHLLWFPVPWRRLLHVPPGQIGPSHQSWQGLFSLAGTLQCCTVKPGFDWHSIYHHPVSAGYLSTNKMCGMDKPLFNKLFESQNVIS